MDAHIEPRPDFSRPGKQHLLKPVPRVGIVVSARRKQGEGQNGKRVKSVDPVLGIGIAIGKVYDDLLTLRSPVDSGLHCIE